MDIIDALGILRRQSSSSRHGITAMGGDNLLVRFETPDLMVSCKVRMFWAISTYAPPELSDPAITSIRGIILTSRFGCYSTSYIPAAVFLSEPGIMNLEMQS